MNKVIIWIIVLLIIVAGAFVLLQGDGGESDQVTPTPEDTSDRLTTTGNAQSADAPIDSNEDAFSEIDEAIELLE